MIIDEILERSAAKAEGRTVKDVRIGLGYVAVQLDDGGCGLAYTFREDASEGCCVMRDAGTIAGRPAAELIRWAGAPDPIAAAVGLAALNAVIEPPAEAAEADIRKILDAGPEDAAGMVGYFGPLIPYLRERAKALYIFERRPQEEGVLPEAEAARLLPSLSVVIISATTLLNRTLDALLEKCAHARTVALAGPSTPFVPEVFARRNVTLLSGVQVADADRVLRVVSEGGGTRQFGAAVRKLTFQAGRFSKQSGSSGFR
jgi:uncharacterized protein (DUF4213/DUF364 family)